MTEKRDAAADLAACEKATPGPWDRIKRSIGCPWPDPAYCGPEGEFPTAYGYGKNRDNDIAFVALAREALPYWIHEAERLRDGIRYVRDQRGDDRCWMDLERLYRLLPEGYTPPARDTLVELKNCEKYIESCHDPRTVYVSPQRRIEELEAENARLRAALEEIAENAVGKEVVRVAREATGETP